MLPKASDFLGGRSGAATSGQVGGLTELGIILPIHLAKSVNGRELSSASKCQ